MFLNHNRIKLEINRKKKFGKLKNMEIKQHSAKGPMT